MRHLHSDSHFRHALFALQDADGYVEALLGMARETNRRAPISFSRPLPASRRDAGERRRPGGYGA